MALEVFANQPNTVVSSGGTDAPSAGTQETWTVNSSAAFPAASSGASPPTQFHVVDIAPGYSSEIIAVTNISGTTWTVTRGAESTVPVVHLAGFTVQQVVTAGFYTSIANPMTTLGDTLYGGASGALTRLAGNTSATKKFWTQTGTGSASTAPTWAVIAAGDVPGATSGTAGTIQLAGDLGGTSSAPEVLKIQGTAVSVPSGGSTSYLNATGGWSVPSGGGGGSSVLDWVSVVVHGADPTGTTDSTTAFNAAITALPSGGGVVYVPSGTYKINSTITFQQNQGMVGDGHAVSILEYTGDSVCVKVALVGAFTGGTEGGWFQGWQVSAYGGGSGAIGMQITDLQGVYGCDLSFYGCGTAGLNFTTGGEGWSEECWFLKTAFIQCGAGAVFNTTSYDYGVFEFTIVSSPGTPGVVVTGGAELEGCRLGIRGDFYANTPNTAGVLEIEPGNTSGTGYVINCDIDIAVETAGSGTGHYIVVMGSTDATSQFICSGILSLFPATVNGQGISNPNFLPFGFSGILNDGTGESMAAGDGLAVYGGSVNPVAGSLTTTLSSLGGTIYNEFSDTWIIELASGSNTIAWSSLGSYGRDMHLLLRQPTSGAAGTIASWGTNIKAPAAGITLTTTNSLVDWLYVKWLGTSVGFGVVSLIGKGYTL